MAKFTNKKEQVYDIRLTAYGRYLISIGDFTPEYYAFFDDNILYDSNYAGFPEQQNHTEERILENTQYLEGLVLFDDVDSLINNEELIDLDNLDLTPTKLTPRKDIFRFVEPIGDAYLDGDTQAAPAWKVVALNGYISSSSDVDSANNSKITQLNVDLNYRKVVIDYEIDPDDDRNTFEDPKDIFDVVNSTEMFTDRKVIKLKTDNGMFYIEEANTEILNENFDIEIFKIEQPKCVRATATIRLFEQGDQRLGNGDRIVISDDTTTRTYFWKTSPDAADDCEMQLHSTGTPAENVVNNLIALVKRITGYSGTYPDCKLNLEVGTVSSTTIFGYTSAEFELASIVCGPEGNQPIYPQAQKPVFTYCDTSFTGGEELGETLVKKYFQKETPQVVDGFMVSNTPETNPLQYYNTSSVEYYFNVLIDSDVPSDEACKASEIFNKQSYYVDLDFDCQRTKDENIFFDIYGIATEPDICETS